jgi:hypothetical protein
MYLHVTLTPKVGKLGQLSDTVAWLKKGMDSPKMRLLGAYQTASGAPGHIVDIWELEDANTIVDALESAAAHPKHQTAMDRLAESLVREQLRLVAPAGYGPGFLAPASSDPRFLHATIGVKYGQLARVSAIIGAVKDVLEAQLGWRLLGAYRTVVGDFGELFDLWEIPAGRTVEDMLDEARAIPAFADAARGLPDLIDREELMVMRPTHYCP